MVSTGRYKKYVVRKSVWDKKINNNRSKITFYVPKGVTKFSLEDKERIREKISNDLEYNKINWQEWENRLKTQNKKRDSNSEEIYQIIKEHAPFISYKEIQDLFLKTFAKEDKRSKMALFKGVLSRFEKEKKIYSFNYVQKTSYNLKTKEIIPLKYFTLKKEIAENMDKISNEYGKKKFIYTTIPKRDYPKSSIIVDIKIEQAKQKYFKKKKKENNFLSDLEIIKSWNNKWLD